MYKFIYLIYFFCSITFATPIIKDCQGEGCGCTYKYKTDEAFFLYKKMQKNTQKIAFIEAETTAMAVNIFTKVIKKGETKITKVLDKSIGLKVGDIVNTVFYLGEGFYKVKKKKKWFTFRDGNVEFKHIQEPEYETWFEIYAKKSSEIFHGYTQIFPFDACLE